MLGKKRKIWVRLNCQQVEAVLAVAEVIDAKPESLTAILPERSNRMAFRGAITALQNVSTGINEASR